MFFISLYSLPTNLTYCNYNHPLRPNSNLSQMCTLPSLNLTKEKKKERDKNKNNLHYVSHFISSYFLAQILEGKDYIMIISLCLICSPNEQAVHCRILIHILMKSFPTKAYINSTNLINQMHT
jgi:hypothetical protein